MVKSANNNKEYPKQNFRKFASTQMNMSARELDLADCFQVGKDICYQRYPYDRIMKGYFEGGESYSQRESNVKKIYQDCVIEENLQCAYQFHDKELIKSLNNFKKQSTLKTYSGTTNYDWIKLGRAKASQLWQLISVLKRLNHQVLEGNKAKLNEKAHGHGVSFGVSAFAGMGVLFNGEVVVHDRQLALFCAPGVSAVSDLGVQMGVGPVKTLGCKNYQDYLGNFLTVSAGISGEMFSLPAGAEVNYSFGFNFNDFVTRLERQVNYNGLDLQLASMQFVEFATTENSFAPQGPIQRLTWYILLKTISNYFEQQSITNDLDEKIIKEAQKISKENVLQISLAKIVKEIVSSDKMRSQLKNKDHLYLLLLEFANSLSGCDSISANALLTVSASPLNFSVLMSNYAMLHVEDLDKLASINNMTAFLMLNPMLLDPETVKYLLSLSSLAINFSEIVTAKCSVPTSEQLILNASKMRDLFDK